MKTLFALLFCFLAFACSKVRTDSKNLAISNTNLSNQKSPEILKEEQLINLLSDKIIDSIGGQLEDGQNLAAIEDLIKNGVDVNARDKSTFQTPLMLAVQNGRPAALRLLLNAKANPDTQDERGQTALMVAARDGDLAMVKLLLEHGADTKLEDNSGYTALTGSEYVNGINTLEPKEKYDYLEIRRLLKSKK